MCFSLSRFIDGGLAKIVLGCPHFFDSQVYGEICHKAAESFEIYCAHSNLEVHKPSSTRFAYMFIVVEQLVQVRKGLMRSGVQRMVKFG